MCDIRWIMRATLDVPPRRLLVRDCWLRPRPAHDDAAVDDGWRDPAPVPGVRALDQLPEPPGEGPETGEPDHHADLGDGEVGMHEKVLGPLDPPPAEVGTRGLPEDAPKLPSEVITGEARRGGHVVEVERLGITGIHEIPSPPKVHHLIGTHPANPSERKDRRERRGERDRGLKAARQQGSKAARQQDSKAARQQGSKAERQQGSKAARQQGSKAARQQGSKAARQQGSRTASEQGRGAERRKESEQAARQQGSKAASIGPRWTPGGKRGRAEKATESEQGTRARRDQSHGENHAESWRKAHGATLHDRTGAGRRARQPGGVDPAGTDA